MQSISTISSRPSQDEAEGGVEPWLRRVYLRAPEGPLRRTASWEQVELPLPSTTREAFLSSLGRQIERIGEAHRERPPRIEGPVWEQVGLDQGKVLLFVSLVAGSFFVLVVLLGQQLRIGSISVVLGAMAAAGAGYLVTTAPRRIVRMAAFRQTLEAPSFAASSNIYLKSTSSRSKTFLMLRAEEPRLRSFLADVRRHILLGYDAPSATLGARPQSHVFSESVRTVISSVVGVDRARIEEGADELDGILNSGGLDEETKLPLLMAVSFFLPIMLMLFAAMTKGTGLAAMGALVVLEVVVLDITLAISGGSVPWSRDGKR